MTSYRIIQTVCVTLIIVCTIALLVMISASPASAAQACRSAPGTDDYYQYRLIGGRKCWYRGHEKLEKSALAWKEHPRAGAKQTLAPPTKAFASQASEAHVPNSEFDSRDGGRNFDETFAHFPAYEVAHPVVHLLFPQRVAQAWGSKRVVTIAYRMTP